MDDLTHFNSIPHAPRASTTELVAHLVACGIKADAIASQAGLTVQQVMVMMKDEKMRFEVKRLQTKLFPNPKKRFQILAERAMEVTEEILDDDGQKPNVRLKAAQEVMDRAWGKPEQTINHDGSLIRRLFEQMDGANAKEVTAPAPPPARIIDLEASPNPNEVEKRDPSSNPNAGGDSIDRWVNENL